MAISKNSKKTDGRLIPANISKYVLTGEGYLQTATGLDVTPVISSANISYIKVIRELAGTSGSTILDINKNGTTIFTTQANRPTFLYSAGNNAIVTPTPDVTSFSENDLLSFDIDQIEGGSAANIRIEIVME